LDVQPFQKLSSLWVGFEPEDMCFLEVEAVPCISDMYKVAIVIVFVVKGFAWFVGEVFNVSLFLFESVLSGSAGLAYVVKLAVVLAWDGVDCSGFLRWGMVGWLW
jgi:hypothetical protein